MSDDLYGLSSSTNRLARIRLQPIVMRGGMERVKDGGMEARAARRLGGARLTLAACLGLTMLGCSGPRPSAEEPKNADQDNWAAAPHIDKVTLQGSGHG